MNKRVSSNETLSIAAWEKTHSAETAACDKESGWKQIRDIQSGGPDHGARGATDEHARGAPPSRACPIISRNYPASCVELLDGMTPKPHSLAGPTK
jgi:hypothetical protein